MGHNNKNVIFLVAAGLGLKMVALKNIVSFYYDLLIF